MTANERTTVLEAAALLHQEASNYHDNPIRAETLEKMAGRLRRIANRQETLERFKVRKARAKARAGQGDHK